MPTPTLAEPSPLMLCDRLISLAQDAGRAGYAITAEHLVHLVETMFDEQRPTVTAAPRRLPRGRRSRRLS
jgi:hypothetical protein